MNRIVISVCVLASLACYGGLLAEAHNDAPYGAPMGYGMPDGHYAPDLGYGSHGGHGGLGGYGGYGGHDIGAGYGGHGGYDKHGYARHGYDKHGYGYKHGSGSGQVRTLLKGATRSVMAQNPELAHKVHQITSNPTVRRQMEKLKPKINEVARKVKPYAHEGAKMAKNKLTETVNKENLKQSYQANGAHYGAHGGPYGNQYDMHHY